MSNVRTRLERIEAALGNQRSRAFELWARVPGHLDRFELVDLMNPERDGATATEVELAQRALANPRPYVMSVEGWSRGNAGDQTPDARLVLAAARRS